MSVTALIGGVDILTKKLSISGTIPPWLSVPASARGTMNLPTRIRSAYSDTDAVAVRTFTLPVSVVATTLAERQSARSWITAQHRQLIVVRMNDGLIVRELVGTLNGIDMTPRKLANNTFCDGMLTVVAYDPTWREVTAVQYVLTTARFALPMETAPVEDWIIELMNPAGDVTNPGALIRSGDGTVLNTLLFTGTNHTTEHVTIDADNGSAVQESGGVVSSIMSHWSGCFPPFTLTDQMTLELTSTGGVPVGLLRYIMRSW